MNILICIDDTDNYESQGTGALADEIAQHIRQAKWGTTSLVTRHQLYIHPDIPFTTHNSSMCFSADIDRDRFQDVVDFCCQYLSTHSALGSDPGLCVVKTDNGLPRDRLISFGQQAKQQVLQKNAAFELASQLHIHLSEHGGTGQGVIGALAGAGLRLSGNDGRFRSWHRFNGGYGYIKVKELCSYDAVDMVQSTEGTILPEEETIALIPQVKTVLLHDKAVVLVWKNENTSLETPWHIVPKQQLRGY
jgi:hypothetical protein